MNFYEKRRVLPVSNVNGVLMLIEAANATYGVKRLAGWSVTTPTKARSNHSIHLALVGVVTDKNCLGFAVIVNSERMHDVETQFFTASILNWTPLLSEDENKDIIVNSLTFLAEMERCEIYAFVIMPNHIHLIWRILEGHTKAAVQRDFLKYTAQQLRFKLIDSKSPLLIKFCVDKNDRKYQIWQRRPLSVGLYSSRLLKQKLEYIHANPVQKRWSLVQEFTDYKYSSASFYESGKTNFEFLKDYRSYFGH